MGFSRCSFYYYSRRDAAFNEHLIRHIDEKYATNPFYGVEKRTHWHAVQEYGVNIKLVHQEGVLMNMAEHFYEINAIHHDTVRGYTLTNIVDKRVFPPSASISDTVIL
ncbi:hypothetical protein ACFL60_08915 [Candidatus Omnitrophota bacterium]